MIRETNHDSLEFETFPKESLLDSYGLSLYAHKGTRHFKPTTIVQLLRRGNPQLKGELEVLESKEFPMCHPMENCLLYTSPSPRDS